METESELIASKQKHDELEFLKNEKPIFVRNFDHFSKCMTESSIVLSRQIEGYYERYNSKFDTKTYLKHCRNVINLAFGKIPPRIYHRRKDYRLDPDEYDEYSDDEHPRGSHEQRNLWLSCLRNIGIDMAYILTHARLFGNQTQNMCTLPESYQTLSIDHNVFGTDMFSMRYNKFNFLDTMVDMIESLGRRYDEAKYMALNANMTYLTLVILRLSVQDQMEFSKCLTNSDTCGDYSKLCPHPLGTALPSMHRFFMTCISTSHKDVLQLPLSLVIHTYLNVKDELTKKILHVTCMKYIEWYEMELPMLFNKVLDLYGLEAGRLWDLLRFEKTSKSLVRLAKFFNNLYQQNVKKPDNNDSIWLPYKIATGGEILVWQYLSASQNVYLCTILACIIDTKLDLKKSYIRNSEWAVDRTAKNTGLKIAKAFHQFYASK